MTAFSPADILLPKLCDEGMKKWAVVACDQYTGEPEYWEKAAAVAGDSPSALRLIFPEAYLDSGKADERIADINRAMREYISSGLFEEYPGALILTRRIHDNGKVRSGLVGAIDLEKYDYSRGSRSEVRATEATVPSRIPPRVRIRKDAPLELPHIMILIDDPLFTVTEPLDAMRDSFKKLYDFELMLGGGHIEGYLVSDEGVSRALSALDALSDKESFDRRYGLSEKEVLLYAVGDGNHSLATAKECYEQKKREGSPDAPLSRYALAELVNLHSEALEFEAIHRVITDVDADKLMSAMTEALGLVPDGKSEKPVCSGQRFIVIKDGRQTGYSVSKPLSNITVGSLQSFLDGYLADNPGKIDYIHGEDVVLSLCDKENSIGFILPAMKKAELFPTVIKDGALPRKTFSMGRACDKRFYCEARRIRKEL